MHSVSLYLSLSLSLSLFLSLSLSHSHMCFERYSKYVCAIFVSQVALDYLGSKRTIWEGHLSKNPPNWLNRDPGMKVAHKFARSLPNILERPERLRLARNDLAATSQDQQATTQTNVAPDPEFGQAKTIGALKLIGLILNILTKVSIHINLCAHRNNKMYYNFLRVCVLHCFSLGVSSL